MIAIMQGRLLSRSLYCAAILGAILAAIPCVLAQEVQQTSQTQQEQQPPPAQDPAAKPAQASDDKTKSEKKTPAPCDPKASDCHQEKDRIFSLVPNYQSVTQDPNKPLPPLTVGGKFKLAAKGAFDPGEFILIGALAAEDQITTDPKSLGQGWGSFGERYALNFADQTIGSFMTGAIFPSILHQDPRYYRKAHGGFWRRSGYALSRTVVIRSDSGSRQFNASEIVGNGVAAGIANAYHPHDERSLTGTAATWGTDIAVDTLANWFKEFWPDIEKKLHWRQISY
jgi:hypothetical protein